jgi:CRISPR type I-E-associated protein CasB/Cse2
MTEPVTEPSREQRFVTHIHQRCADPGSRALLRRGYRKDPDSAHTLHRFVVPFLQSRHDADRFYAAASWVAMFGAGRTGLSFGAAVRNTATLPGNNYTALEKRLSDLVRTTPEVLLCDRLPRLLNQMQQARQIPDMALLLEDLRSWNLRKDRVFRRWMTDFYRTDTQ